MYLNVSPLRGPGSDPGHGGGILRDFSLADHTLPTRSEPAWQKMAQSPLNGITQTVYGHQGGKVKSNHG